MNTHLQEIHILLESRRAIFKNILYPCGTVITICHSESGHGLDQKHSLVGFMRITFIGDVDEVTFDFFPKETNLSRFVTVGKKAKVSSSTSPIKEIRINPTRECF